ncbi:MAG: T9SS type A sorting domain-containing protein [Rhodothermales bacterium]
MATSCATTDLMLEPGADLSQVRVRLDGADGVKVTAEGALQMGTSLGTVEQRGLLAYHEGPGGQRQRVECTFVVGADGTVEFHAEADPGRALVVDPLIWASFLGGTSYDRANAVAMSPGGAVTVVGATISSSSFPMTVGAYDPSPNGDLDAFIAQLSADGTTLTYATFLGGSDIEDAIDVAVAADGSTTVAGWTRSTDFPTTTDAFDTSYNGGMFDVFVARLAPDGDALTYATFLGGSSEDYGDAVALGADGSATVVGSTPGFGFPTTTSAYDPSHNGIFDAFVTRLSPDGSTLVYSTFLGGPSEEHATSVAVGVDGSATVVGNAAGAGFPTTAGAYDRTHNGDRDVFVTRLSPDGSALAFSTFLGGLNLDVGNAVAVGVDGAATVVGWTQSEDFPATSRAFDTSYNGGFSDAFVTQITSDGSALVYSTFFGGLSEDRGYSVVLGVDGAPTVAGYTRSASLPSTDDASDPSYNGGQDAFVARLSPDGSALAHSTFLGGTDTDEAFAVALGTEGTVVVIGRTVSEGFPATTGAYDTSFNGGLDVFVAQLEILAPTAAEGVAVPAVLALGAAYPNPLRDSATFVLEVPDATAVRVVVYDVLGRTVAVLADTPMEAGRYEVALEASSLAPGTYLVRMTAGSSVATQRVTVVR